MASMPVTYAAPQTYAAAPVTYAAPAAQPQYAQQSRVVMGAQPQYAQSQPQYAQSQPQYVQPAAPQYVQSQPQAQYVQPQPQVQYMQQQPQAQYVQQQPQYVQQAQPMMMQAQPQYMQQSSIRMQPAAAPAGGIAAVKDCSEVDDNQPPAPAGGRVFVLATGIDYSCDKVSWAGKAPLDTKYAHDMFIDLAHRSGAQVFAMWNEEMTRENLRANIMQVGQMCGPDDTFVFYYTGHGDQLPNDNPAAEGEANDQCLCLLDANGSTDGPQPDTNVRNQIWMRDDEFAHTVLDAVRGDSKILIVLDCCHSETMCDMTPNSPWNSRKQPSISICGCKDKQTSAGTGHGGQFSRALVTAIQDLNQEGKTAYNVSAVYNKIQKEYLAHKQAGHTQNISMHGVVKAPNQVAWPLIPQGHYVAPLQ